MTVRVRFAPSPTGHVHIGNIRVAIFNWLFARHHGGKFLLRIEDTDRERSTPQAIRTLLDAMEWLGLLYDEEAMYQSSRAHRHEDVARDLLDRGHASRGGDGEPVVLHLDASLYDPSFVTDPRDAATVKVAKGRLLATPRVLRHIVVSSSGEEHVTPYAWDALANLRIVDADGGTHDGAALRKTVETECDGFEVCEMAVENLIGTAVAELRFDRRYVFYDDLVLGRREKPLDSLRDLVIVRSDGSPVFHLANVVDDWEMGVTHILRGNDHVENTFRHLFLYRALGAEPPRYAHLPMIVNEKGKPYSKRDGDAYVGDFRARGVLPECLFNFLALCGWSPGDDREILGREEMVQAFSLDRVKDSPAQFNAEKLAWMNGQYLSAKPAAELAPLIREALEAEGISVPSIDPAWLAKLIDLEKERLRSLSEFVQNTHFFWVDAVEYQPKAVKKNLLKKEKQGAGVLAEARPVLAGLESWDVPTLDGAMSAFAETRNLGMGQVAQPIRTAVTGTGVSRGIWETLELLGRERTLERIDACLKTVSEME